MGKKKGPKFTPLDPSKHGAEGTSQGQQQQGAQQPPAGGERPQSRQQPQESQEPQGASSAQMQPTKKQKGKGGGQQQQPQAREAGESSQPPSAQAQGQPGASGDGGGGKGKKKKGGQQQQPGEGPSQPQPGGGQQQQPQAREAGESSQPPSAQAQGQPGASGDGGGGKGKKKKGGQQQQPGEGPSQPQPGGGQQQQPQAREAGEPSQPPSAQAQGQPGASGDGGGGKGKKKKGGQQQQPGEGPSQPQPAQKAQEQPGASEDGGAKGKKKKGGQQQQQQQQKQTQPQPAQQPPPGVQPPQQQPVAGYQQPPGFVQRPTMPPQAWQGQPPAHQPPPGVPPPQQQPVAGYQEPLGFMQRPMSPPRQHMRPPQGWQGQPQQHMMPPQGQPGQHMMPPQGWQGQPAQGVPVQGAPVQPAAPARVQQPAAPQTPPVKPPEESQQQGGRGRGGPQQQKGGQGQGGKGRGGSQQQGGRGPRQQQAAGGRPQQQGDQQQQGKSPQSTPSRSSSVSSVSSLAGQTARVTISEPRQAGTGDAQLVCKMRVTPGTKGRKIPVESNHLELNLGTLKEAYHYDVAIDPNVPKKFLRPVVEAFRKKHFPNRHPAFDGMKNIYATQPLSGNLNNLLADTIVLPTEDGRDKTFKVEIKYANTVDLRPLRDFLSHAATPQEALQCVDVVLRMAPVLTCLPVGRSFFLKPDRIIDLGQGMEMYNGFYQSAIRGWKPLLNVDVAHKAFPKAMPVIDALCEILTQNPRNPMTREHLGSSLQSYQTETFRKYITTLRVTYEIPGHPGTRRGYRVNGIDQCPKDKKFTHEGRNITIADYFQNVKNYRLRYPLLPTLWVGNMQRVDKVLLPIELCTINEGQAVNRKMTENQTSNMIRYAATNTEVRKQKIMRGVTTAKYNQHPCVKEFGFSVSSEFQKLEARVLNPPELAYGNNRKVRPSRGVWRNDKFLEGITINKWTIANVNRYPPRGDDLPNMAKMLRRHAGECGMYFATDAEAPFDNIGGKQGLQDMQQYFKMQKQKNFDIIFVVVPDSGPQYSYVKSAAELNVGCLTQCIKSRTLGRMNPQTVVNILLKVNSKLNGKNHCLSTRPPIMGRPVMIMGADVTHPSPDSTNIPSVAAVTASHDPKAFQYNICWRLQPPKVEIIEDLEAIVVEQLKFFYSKTKVKPEAIVFFRDGVSEGQFEQVKNAEIRAIRSACRRLQADGYEPKITFLVVQKRHHTRLFPLNPRDSEDKNMNVPAGTCVDTTITHPYMQDFYLVSHASIQGVAKPTKYCTLWDDNNMDNDQVEELTYYLCHMFTRCNRSVSYPAPTYYAHLAAARAKVYIENDNLNLDRLQDEFRKYQIKDEIRKQLPMFFV